MIDTASLSNAALIIVVALGMYLSAFWLALIFWTFRDHRRRSRDGLASIAAAVMVAILGLPGLLIYLLLRPRETLSEAYERSLEEEALLQDIEEKPICPGCGRPAHPDWQICPHCHTTLRKSCAKCGHILELAWTLCPYCGTPQPALAVVDGQQARAVRRPAQQPAAPEPAPRRTNVESAAAPAQSLEYIDDDPYQR
jgi:RNA polymerase subunit RPABC4/transcription elongation factor Spt4